MKYDLAFVRRVALILGVSFASLSSALADGRVVLPPKPMVQSYLSGVSTINRDMIVMAMIPGAGGAAMFLGSRQKVLEGSQSLPAMTSNTAPSGHVALSSLNKTADYLPFDQSLDTTGTLATASFPCWFQRKTPSPIQVGRYGIAPAQDSGLWDRSPRDWALQGSNDGTNFTILDAQTGISFSSNATKFFDILPANQTVYTFHRLNVTAKNAGTNMFFTELILLQML